MMRWFAALLLFLLSGCSTQKVHIDTPSVSERFQAMAQTREAAGDYRAAADYYVRAATVASIGQRPVILLQAAENLIAAGEYDRSTDLLERLATTRLSASQRQRLAVLHARIALVRNDAEQVLRLLQSTPASDSLKVDYYRYRAEAWQLKGNLIAALGERLRLDPLLERSDQRLANAAAIWGVLSRLTRTDLQRLRTKSSPESLNGWIDLLEVTRQNSQNQDELAEAILQWQIRYPDHPASDGLTEMLSSGTHIAGQPPQRLALLVPLSGTLAGAGAAIRDGLLAAYYRMPVDSERPVIRIYDAGGDPGTIMDRYLQAVSEGAQFVIGPLRKEAVEVLSRGQLPVPVLALNRADEDTASNPLLFQFGLAPEDEAREIARRAWHDGHGRAIALVPDGYWGERVYDAFLEEWQQLGGRLLEVQRYDPHKPDHGHQISAVLNLDGSRQRQQRLVRLLGSDLAFEPRCRKDIDFIFLLASPEQGRLIHPQLKFYRAERIPVYATSHVYTGQPDNYLDSDLDGLIFCDIPWILDPAWKNLQTLLGNHWPDEFLAYSRLYALGFDAWGVIPYLIRAQDNTRGTYTGATGELTLDDARRIHRKLRWAHFRNGLPVALKPGADTLEEQDLMSAGNSKLPERELR